jgi:AcrR family transcriptional regulator
MNARSAYHSELREARAAATRRRILDAVAAVMEHGEEPTFAAVAREADCQERTVYRYFSNREELAREFWRHQGMGSIEREPRNLAELHTLVDQAFRDFDRRPALIRAMLHTEHGRASRRSAHEARQRMREQLVETLLPELPKAKRRKVAAATHVLFSASAWEQLTDFWGLSGGQAAEVVKLALAAMFQGLSKK